MDEPEYVRLSAKLIELIEAAGPGNNDKLRELLIALPDGDLPPLFGIALVELHAKRPQPVPAETMETARSIALTALRPATLAAEFRVDKKIIVDALAVALLPFVIKEEKRRRK